VALCDEHTRLVGLVTVERVLGRLAYALDAGSSDNSHDAPMLAPSARIRLAQHARWRSAAGVVAAQKHAR
jgi:hypothetical protein